MSYREVSPQMRRIPVMLLAFLMLSLWSPAALAGGVTRGEEQKRALDELNKIRKSVGLPAVTLSSALNYAATGHSRYVLETSEYGHYESNSSSPYYIGYAPKDRAGKYGYHNSSITENFYMGTLGATGTRTYYQVDNSLAWWMSAIYHRFPMISPRVEQIGYGPYYKSGRGSQVLDFGTDYALSGPVTRWPRPYQTGILTGFHGERPNPVAQFGRTCTSTDPCGYPVSMTWYKGAVKYTSITLKRASDGLAISGYRLSPQNDQFHNWSMSLSFIPQKALAYNTKYTASFQGKFNPTYGGNPDNGTAFSYTWSFTTLPPPGNLVSSSPVNGATGTSRLPSVSLSFSRSLRVYTLVGTPYSALRTGGIGMSLARGRRTARSWASLSRSPRRP